MQNEAVQWQIQSMTVRSSGFSQLFSLYAFGLFFLGCWKITRLWRICLSRLPGSAGGFVQELEKVHKSIGNWTKLTFLIWGIYLSLMIARACVVWAPLSAHYISIWPNALHEMATFTAVMLFFMTILFLCRWWVERRAGSMSE